MKNIIKIFWKSIIWLILICYLCLTPSESLPPMPKLFEFDKIGHLMLYLIFTILLIKSLTLRLPDKLNSTKVKWLSLSISIVIGGLIEILQANVVQNRHGDIYDFMADTVGAILGLTLYNFVAKNFYKLI